MRRGLLYEESAVCTNAEKEQKVWTTLNVLQWIFMIGTAIGVFFSFFNIPLLIGLYLHPEEGEPSVPGFIISLVVWLLGIAATALVAVVFWRFKLKRNLSYDYTFVEDELRISKVFNGKKRKFLHRLKADQILKIGYCDRPSFESIERGYTKKTTVYLTPNFEPAEGKHFFYIVYSDSIGKTLYIVEAREELLEYIVPAVGMQKFERQ